MGTVACKQFDPFRSISSLLSDLFADCPWSIHFNNFIPAVSTRHTHTFSHMRDTGNRDKSFLLRKFQCLAHSVRRIAVSDTCDSFRKCRLRMLKCIHHNHLIIIVEAVRLAEPVSQMCMHIGKSRQNCCLPIIFDFFLRILGSQFFLLPYFCNFAILSDQHCRLLKHGASVSGNQMFRCDYHVFFLLDPILSYDISLSSQREIISMPFIIMHN